MAHVDTTKMGYRGPERREGERWRFKREISWGDIAIVASVVMGALLWGRSIETRLIALDTAQVLQQRVDAKQDEAVAQAVSRIELAIRDQGNRTNADLRDLRTSILTSTVARVGTTK